MNLVKLLRQHEGKLALVLGSPARERGGAVL